MAPTPPSIAATSTLAMVRAAGARGIDTAPLLAEAGLTAGSIEDPDARIPAPTVLALWERLREATGDPALQLVAPVSLPFGAYRVIDYLVGASATVGDGTDCFARFFGLIAEGVSLVTEEHGDGFALRLSRADGAPVPGFYADYLFSAYVSRVRMRIRPALRVAAVELRQSEPAWGQRHREVFDAPVRFGAEEDRLLFDAEEWSAPMDTADEALATLLEEHARMLAGRLPRTTPGFRTDVEEAIAASLPGGASEDDVARRLHVSVRTLQRKLRQEGTSFREVAEDVFAHVARTWLAKPDVSIAEVAFLLGFSDPSSFTRAFRRWTGEAPGRWRTPRG